MKSPMKRSLAIGLLFVAACPETKVSGLGQAPIEASSGIDATDEPISPLPISLPLSAEKIALGELLFASPLLSADGSLSCLGCHPLDRGGTDGKIYSQGVHGKLAAVNTPTIFNVGFAFRLNWNGAFSSLEAQLSRPLEVLMGSSISDVLTRIRSDKNLSRRFSDIYPQGVTETNFRDAIATYERSLFTPNARFDRYLRGEKNAISDEELQGYKLFKEYGCVSCHQGQNVGGNMFQKFGVMGDYFADRKKAILDGEQGRFEVTKKESDRYVFRVPSLRNVALSAPYFHDGSAPTLEAAISVMARYQLGRSIPQPHVIKLAAFLRTLTGEFRGKPLQ
ncbi:MAG TPA: cytochrome c peroxidase [Pseudomonadota bacterium]|nr:cytochrome c peroxidase [Pseudomonadota bacterium]